jgi:hypothetical protein
MRKMIRGLTAVMAAVGGLVLAEPAAHPAQTASAAKWTFHVSSAGDYCADCCPGGFLCCDVPESCSN